MTELILNEDIYRRVILDLVPSARKFLWIVTAEEWLRIYAAHPEDQDVLGGCCVAQSPAHDAGPVPPDAALTGPPRVGRIGSYEPWLGDLSF